MQHPIEGAQPRCGGHRDGEVARQVEQGSSGAGRGWFQGFVVCNLVQAGEPCVPVQPGRRRQAAADLLNTIVDTGLVPVFYHADVECAKKIAEAVEAGGALHGNAFFQDVLPVATTDGVASNGAVHVTLDPSGTFAGGRWMGLSHDGINECGKGALARDKDVAVAGLKALLPLEGTLKELPEFPVKIPASTD